MKQVIIVMIAMFLFTLSAQAAVVSYLEYTTGVGVTYDETSGDLAWRGGGFSFLQTSMGGINFTDTDVTFDWDLSNDISVSPDAAAWFDIDGTWEVKLYDAAFGSGTVLTLTGTVEMTNPHFSGKYLEEENSPGSHEGATYLEATGISIDSAAWQSAKLGGQNLTWDGDNIVGLETDISFSGNVDDFDLDGYSTASGMTMKIWSEESEVVPEPMTIALLGLGGMFLRRRKA